MLRGPGVCMCVRMCCVCIYVYVLMCTYVYAWGLCVGVCVCVFTRARTRLIVVVYVTCVLNVRLPLVVRAAGVLTILLLFSVFFPPWTVLEHAPRETKTRITLAVHSLLDRWYTILYYCIYLYCLITDSGAETDYIFSSPPTNCFRH